MKQIYIIILLIFLLTSCNKKTNFVIDVELPETSVVSSSSRWGVVKYPYIRVRKSPDAENVISSAFRQGDIVKIMKSTEFSTSTSGEDTVWVFTVLDDVEGWVEGSDLSIYESREQAITASKMF